MVSATEVDTLVLGAGPAGLAAAYRLSTSNIRPVVVERASAAGGMMRSIRRGDFIVDIGRKEMYSRIPEVAQLWSALLGNDYRTYSHRVGSLWAGHIIELSSRYRGIRRGMPWGMFLTSCCDLLWGWIDPTAKEPSSFEEYCHRIAGRCFSRSLAQGYWEKFRGEQWSSRPVDTDVGSAERIDGLRAAKRALTLALGDGAPSGPWRHPARGAGQICEILEKRIMDGGGVFRFSSQVTGLVTSGGEITEVLMTSSSEPHVIRPRHVIAGIPLELLGNLLLSERRLQVQSVDPIPPRSRRSVVLVYLFINTPPRFSHAFLEVNDTALKAGRITNYAALNGDMVPDGQTCLCVEYFCWESDSLMQMSPVQLSDLAKRECAEYALLEPAECFDSLVIKLRGADPAASWRDWLTKERADLWAEMNQFRNLYVVTRPGTDMAMFAGLEAAQAIISGNREHFMERTDPLARATPPALSLMQQR
jgi:protoporphyrinogen oxidase